MSEDLLQSAEADQLARIARLERRVERERSARLEAEATAERGLRDLYEINQDLDRRVQERVAESEMLAREANRAERVKSTFLANVSHELRTPLLAVAGSLEVLETELPDLLADNPYFRAAVKGSDRLRTLLDELFEIVDLESGSSRNSRSHVDLASFIAEVADRWRRDAAMAGLLLTTSVSPNVGTAHIDADRLSRALDRLLNNAVTYSDKGMIELGLDRVDDQMIFTVADQGKGMSEELVARLHEPFELGDSAANRSHGGAGLGLTLARGMVALIGGTFTIESTEGTGTTVTVTVPEVANDPEPLEKPRSRA